MQVGTVKRHVVPCSEHGVEPRSESGDLAFVNDELAIDDAHVRFQALVLVGNPSATSTRAAEPIHLFGVHVHASLAEVLLQGCDLSASLLGSCEPERVLRTTPQQRHHGKARHSPLSVIPIAEGRSVVQNDIAHIHEETTDRWRENATVRGADPRDPEILARVRIAIRRNDGAAPCNANLDHATPCVSGLTVDQLDVDVKSLPRLYRRILIAGSSRANAQVPERAFISASQAQRASIRFNALHETTCILVTET